MAFEVTSKRTGDAQLIQLYGELDLPSSPRLEQVLRQAEESDATRIVVDLSGLEFIDSTGLNLLMQAHTRSLDDGERLRLVRGSGQVDRVMKLTGLDAHLPFIGA